MQVVYVCTGCDFISFFNGIGKASFLSTLFEYCEFICSNSDQTPGVLTETCHASQGFLSFLRLVGCAYFRKHRSSAYPTPMTLFHSTANSQQTALKNHSAWLEFLKERIRSRIKYEEEMILVLGQYSNFPYR